MYEFRKGDLSLLETPRPALPAGGPLCAPDAGALPPPTATGDGLEALQAARCGDCANFRRLASGDCKCSAGIGGSWRVWGTGQAVVLPDPAAAHWCLAFVARQAGRAGCE